MLYGISTIDQYAAIIEIIYIVGVMITIVLTY